MRGFSRSTSGTSSLWRAKMPMPGRAVTTVRSPTCGQAWKAVPVPRPEDQDGRCNEDEPVLSFAPLGGAKSRRWSVEELTAVVVTSRWRVLRRLAAQASLKPPRPTSTTTFRRTHCGSSPSATWPDRHRNQPGRGSDPSPHVRPGQPGSVLIGHLPPPSASRRTNASAAGACSSEMCSSISGPA